MTISIVPGANITSLGRNFVGDPNIVTMVCTNTLADITTAGYLTNQYIVEDINLLQNGEFEWSVTDLVLIYYSPLQIGFFVRDAVNNAFDALAPSGGLANTLQNGDIFVGNGANVATGVVPSGDITLTNTGVFGIAAGAIVNADINAAAAIAFSKLATLASANILVGSAGGVPTSVAVTGDIAISNTGVTSISAGSIINLDINAAAAIDFSKLATLASTNILVGSAGGVATSVAMTGDVTISNTGVTTIGAGTIDLAMLSAGITPSDIVVFAGKEANAGGSATITITQAGVLVTDIVFAQVQASTNAVSVQKVTPTADTITVLLSGDPGAATVVSWQVLRAAA